MWWWFHGVYLYGHDGWHLARQTGPQKMDLRNAQALLDTEPYTNVPAPPAAWAGLWRWTDGAWELFAWRDNYLWHASR